MTRSDSSASSGNSPGKVSWIPWYIMYISSTNLLKKRLLNKPLSWSTSQWEKCWKQGAKQTPLYESTKQTFECWKRGETSLSTNSPTKNTKRVLTVANQWQWHMGKGHRRSSHRSSMVQHSPSFGSQTMGMSLLTPWCEGLRVSWNGFSTGQNMPKPSHRNPKMLANGSSSHENW